ncbi:MAG TPA: oligosaccharide flippase family protein [Thermoanaerobaculia bacterium]|jgi:O-antigen/teichoic acid export membrane protein
MDGLRRNLAANLAGTFWFGALTVLLVPLYVRLLGVEAFGLIAFQTTLAGMVVLFDAGLSVNTNRELARLSVTPGAGAEAHAVTRTTEVVYWSIAATVGTILLALTPLIAGRWLNVQQLPPEVVLQAVSLAVVAAILQFPYTFYSAGLLGLQQHVTLNAILIAGTTVRAVGSVLLLLTVSRDVRLLFAWHAVASLLQTLAAAIALHKALPPGKGRFERDVLRRAFGFARGVALSTTLGVAATQVDKLAVSKLLPLATFGHYSIAWMLAAAIALAVTPVQTTVFPRLSQLVAAGDTEGARRAYHRATQTVAAMLLPLAAIATMFAYEIALLWTRDAAVARAVQWLAVFLVIGAMLNALSHISHAFQLANGWTAPAVIANAVQLAVMIPLTLFAIHQYGAVGAAATWALLQLSFLVVSLTVTHRRAMRGDARRVLLYDIGPAFVASFAVAAAGRLLVGEGSRTILAISLVVAGSAVLLAGALSTAVVRDWLRMQWR